MSNVTGKIAFIDPRSTDYGTMYSIKVDGEKYSTGKIKPPASVGDTVSFEYEMNGKYRNANMKTFEVVPGGGNAAPSVGGAATRSYAESQDGRQNSIVRQNALSSAVAFLGVLASMDAIPGIGKTMKAEDKYGLINALLIETADEFFNANIKGNSLGEKDTIKPRAGGAKEQAEADESWG